MKKQRQKAQPEITVVVLLVVMTTMSYLLAGLAPRSGTASAAISPVVRRVNIPYLGNGPPVEFFEPAIFWFGQVTPTINNADVRLWYYDEYMKITVHIIDRRLWFDESPSLATLEEWDAVTLLMNLDGITGDSPTSNSYRLVAQLWGGSDRQAVYQGNGTAWLEAPVSFTAEPTWRGDYPNNDNNDKGWQLTYIIPFSSLGLSERPANDTEWGFAVVLHDRDEADGDPVIADQAWPELADADVPATWGVLNFGIPGYNQPVAVPQGTTIIRQGLNGAEVIDGHVGGHGNCGDGLDHWSEWGEANYVGYTQINIQNQWDISDYPCFSKYFVSFPLDKVPPGKTILAASLSMTMFSNAGGGEWGLPPDSYIQVLAVAEAWDEQTLNWNNAPRAVENISGTWVKPVQSSEQRHYSWDVSRAAAGAYQEGQPLRLALYSADGEQHSGKYFWSSEARGPSLQVIWGEPCNTVGVECHFTYLPAISR